MRLKKRYFWNVLELLKKCLKNVYAIIKDNTKTETQWNVPRKRTSRGISSCCIVYLKRKASVQRKQSVPRESEPAAGIGGAS